MALSLYRKYRPNTFAEVVGQEHVERTLENAVAEGSVAHAYLFCGPRGTGKTTSARLLAKALLCENGPTSSPCGTCPQCAEIAQGTHPDVYELDAASRTGVDNVREEIIGRVQFAPTRGRYKIYIIDEVHMLTTQAFNALLKTLEEPPEHIVFVLCTTDPHKVPETIQSRCQRFDFRRFTIDEIVGYLQRVCAGEGFTFETEALEFIAAKADGGMRDATTSLEQVAVFTQGAITLEATRGLLGQMDSSGLFEVAGYIAARDAASCFRWVNNLVGNGLDVTQCAKDLAGHMRNLYVTALTGGANGIVACPSSELPRYQEQARQFGGTERLNRALCVCGDLVRELRSSADARLSLEIALTRLCRAESELTLEALSERLEALETSGVCAAPQPAPAPRTVATVEPQPAAEPRPAAIVAPQPEPEPRPAAPEPVPEPAPDPAPVVAAPAAESMSPARAMAAILTAVKREDEAAGALLTGVELAHDDSGYHLMFPQGASFSIRLASSGETHALLVRAFNSVIGEGTAFDCREAKQAGGPARAQKPDFGTVSASEAAAPTVPADDGYLEAQAAFADSAYAGFDEGYAPMDAEPYAEEEYAQPAPAAAAIQPEPAAEPKHAYAPATAPADDDPYAALNLNNAPRIDQGTADSLADALSVFGGGIKFEEIE